MRALNKAIALANIANAKITLAHVIPWNLSNPQLYDSCLKSLKEDAHNFMERAEKIVTRENVSVEEKILYGKISAEILKFIKKKKIDLVVMGRRGQDHPPNPYVGSVSNALVQLSTVPVLVVT